MMKEYVSPNLKYRGRLAGVLFDSDVIKEADELRGDVPRSRYVNEALREYNRHMAIIREKIV
jgi:hypothetical protein